MATSQAEASREIFYRNHWGPFPRCPDSSVKTFDDAQILGSAEGRPVGSGRFMATVVFSIADILDAPKPVPPAGVN